MARRASPETASLPLLVWREEDEVARLERQCVSLRERIGRLPPHAFRRIELQARIKDLRTRQLEIVVALRRGQGAGKR